MSVFVKEGKLPSPQDGERRELGRLSISAYHRHLDSIDHTLCVAKFRRIEDVHEADVMGPCFACDLPQHASEECLFEEMGARDEMPVLLSDSGR